MQKSTLLALIYALFLLLLCTDLALFTFAREWHVRFIAGEDRATEWLTFTFFLGAALAGVGIVRKHSANNHSVSTKIPGKPAKLLSPPRAAKARF